MPIWLKSPGTINELIELWEINDLFNSLCPKNIISFTKVCLTKGIEISLVRVILLLLVCIDLLILSFIQLINAIGGNTMSHLLGKNISVKNWVWFINAEIYFLFIIMEILKVSLIVIIVWCHCKNYFWEGLSLFINFNIINLFIIITLMLA